MKKFILFCLVAFTAVSVTTAQNKQTQNATVNKRPAADKAVEITFVKEVIDYGKIPHYSNGTKVFKFKNTGTKPLLIATCEAGCGCTAPTWPKKAIKPGESGEIIVKYATDRVGKFQKTVTVFSNAKTNAKVLTIKGEVSPYPKTLPPGVKPFDAHQ